MKRVSERTDYVVKAFRSGNDTFAIAESLHEKEHVVERILHAGLAEERCKMMESKSEPN